MTDPEILALHRRIQAMLRTMPADEGDKLLRTVDATLKQIEALVPKSPAPRYDNNVLAFRPRK